MKIRDSVVAVVSTAIQDGAIISIDFLEPSPMWPRSGKGEVIQQVVYVYQLLSCTLPDTHAEVISKNNLEKSPIR